MTVMRVLVDETEVNNFLTEHGLEQGAAPIEVALLQYEGTVAGGPALMLVLDVGGRKVLAKTTLRLMDMAVHAMLGAVERLDADAAKGH